MPDLERLGLPSRWGLVALAALLAGGLAALATIPGLLTGWLALVLIVVVLALIPTATTLSGRLFSNSLLGCALIYLGWMVPSPPVLAHGERLMVGLLALAGGVLAARALGLLRVPLLPEVRFIDLVALAAPVIAGLRSLRLWFGQHSLEQAYGTLSAFWDNSSHYYIVSAMHQWQTITRVHPTPPDGSANGFIDYPVGYHSTAATMLDLVIGDPAHHPGPHQIGFLVVAGAMALLGLLIAATGVAALTSVRDAGVWGPFAVGAAVSVLAFGPGFLPQANTQYNFFFAIVLVFAAVLAAIRLGRFFDPIPAVTVLAAVLLAGGAWLPLGLLAAALAGVLFWPLGRDRWRGSPVERAAVIGVAIIVVIFTVIPLSWLTSTFTVDVFATATGGVSPVNAFLPMLASCALAFVVIVLLTRRAEFRDATELTRLTLVGAALVIAMIGYVIIESITMSDQGAELPTYYPQKLFNSFAILLLLVLATIAAPFASRLVGRLTPADLPRRLLAGLLAATIGLGSFWVAHVPALGRGGLAAEDVEVPEDLVVRPDLAAACRSAAQLPPEQVGIIATGRATDTLICAADRLAYTSHAWQVNADTMELWDEKLVAAARPYLEAGSATLIVDPFVLEFYRDEVGPGLADRVIAWQW